MTTTTRCITYKVNRYYWNYVTFTYCKYILVNMQGIEIQLQFVICSNFIIKYNNFVTFTKPISVHPFRTSFDVAILQHSMSRLYFYNLHWIHYMQKFLQVSFSLFVYLYRWKLKLILQKTQLRSRRLRRMQTRLSRW